MPRRKDRVRLEFHPVFPVLRVPHVAEVLRIHVVISACNPYLAFAVMLAAGLKGIEEKCELPPEMTENLFELTEEQRREKGIETLPGSLGEAIAATEKSELVRETLGDHAFERFIWNKKNEWDEFRIQVTNYELEKLLPIL